MDQRLLAALDPGTTFSGFSSAAVRQGQDSIDVKLNYGYPDAPGNFDYCKQPSSVLYKKLRPAPRSRRDYDYIATGFSVDAVLRRVPKEELGNYVSITHPKLVLADPVPAHVQLPPGLEPLDIITDWLRSLHNIAAKHFDDAWRLSLPDYDASKIQWTITIPASWSHSSKEIVRKAAHAADILTSHDSAQLLLRTEPEAAAIAVLDEHKNLVLQRHDSVMVIDAGGGTVDFSLHEVTSSSGGRPALKELVPCEAELAGASFVDSNFVSYAQKQLGISSTQWQDWAHKQPAHHRRLMLNNWENAKRTFGERGELLDIRIELPPSLVRLLSENVINNLDEEQLVIPAATVQHELFDPVVSKIVLRAQQMAAVVGTVQYVFLAGGFSSSPYLRSQLEDKLQGVIEERMYTVINGGTAVLKGAVLAAHNKEVIAARKSKYSYGTETSTLWNKSIPQSLKKWDATRKEYRCDKKFNQYVSAHEDVLPGAAVTKTFYPVYVGQTAVAFDVYATPKEQASYTNEPGMMHIGTARLVLPAPSKTPDSEPIDVTVTFGQAELQLTAVDRATKKRVQAILQFERTV